MGALIPLQAQGRTKTKVRLVLEQETLKPGDSTTAAVVLQMPPGWHTYWQYPGDSGGATEIAWDLPPGITAGPIQWPVPEKYVDSDLTTYVHHDEAALLVEIRTGKDLAPGDYPIKAKVSWLECEKVCVMGSGRISGTLKIGPDPSAPSNATQFAEWRSRLPGVADPSTVSSEWEVNGTDRTLKLSWAPPGSVDRFDFYPIVSKEFEISGATSDPVRTGTMLQISKEAKALEAKWPDEIHGILAWNDAGGARKGLQVTFKPKLPMASVAPPAVPGSQVVPPAARSMVFWMGLAVLGGFILNFMPCVLPVIALKILGFVGHGGSSKAETRKLGLLYGLGVWVSFLVLAGTVIGVKQAGMAASWGMQLQNPIMLVMLTTLVTLVALNLFGVFEITLAGNAMGAAGKLAAKEGAAGAFFNGVLATVLATPCTAPALGAALGFAFTQPPITIVVIFSCVAFGLAVPYVILCWEPAWLKFLPKPGVWMERFKIGMGFPMIATAVWLFTIASDFYGDGGDLWLGIFLVLVALSAWIWGTFVQRGSKHRGVAIGIALTVLLAACGWVLESELKWRSPAPSGSSNHDLRKPGGIPWEPWSPEAVAKARAEGRPVFVDFTAKWCLTCKLNKRRAIEKDVVRDKLKQINAVALVENSPVKSAEVVAELNRYGRAGVPLNLVYPKDPSKPPILLPELILTPDTVLEALDKAAK